MEKYGWFISPLRPKKLSAGIAGLRQMRGVMLPKNFIESLRPKERLKLLSQSYLGEQGTFKLPSWSPE